MGMERVTLGMLVDMLKQNKKFKELNNTQQQIMIKLADMFENDLSAIYNNPKELVETTGIGTEKQWREFLKFDSVGAFIATRLGDDADIGTRKALQAVQVQAQKGDVQAAKFLAEAAGIYAQGDKNKVIVMVRAPRPELVRVPIGQEAEYDERKRTELLKRLADKQKEEAGEKPEESK